jgi:hypothetical protein
VGGTQTYVDVLFFENPHLANGFELGPLVESIEEGEGMYANKGVYADGLLVRADASSTSSTSSTLVEPEEWHYHTEGGAVAPVSIAIPVI